MYMILSKPGADVDGSLWIVCLTSKPDIWIQELVRYVFVWMPLVLGAIYILYILRKRYFLI
jgi:hypothetical protein